MKFKIKHVSINEITNNDNKFDLSKLFKSLLFLKFPIYSILVTTEKFKIENYQYHHLNNKNWEKIISSNCESKITKK